MSYNVCSNNTECSMTEREEGEMNIVAVIRLIMASISVLGAMSIIASAICRKLVCNPKVQPIFVLSIVDVLVSVLWMSGSAVWLNREAHSNNGSSLGCFSINLLTVALQCTAMNVTLIYALLAYSSIKQRRVYMIQQTPVSVRVWHPLCSFLSYLIAWTLPATLVLIPFTVLSVKYGLVQKANDCFCWCLPYNGNVLPRLQLGSVSSADQEDYKLLLHFFITSYSVVLTANFFVVLCSLVVVYCKVFLRIRHIKLLQAQAEGVPLQGATQAMILAGQKDAQTRVTFFLSIFFISGIITFAFGIANISTQVEEIQYYHHHYHYHHHTTKTLRKYFIFLLFEAVLVPIQGFLNALAYGWTRSDFVSVMTSRRISSQTQSLSLPHGAIGRQRDMEYSEDAHNASSVHEGCNEELKDDGSVSPVSLDALLGED